MAEGVRAADRCPHRGASLSLVTSVSRQRDDQLSLPRLDVRREGGLAACIQEGPLAMLGKVRTKAYPVEERLGVVWVWIGDLAPVPVEDDLPVAMKVPGSRNFVHFTRSGRPTGRLLFDNFIDGLHAPYLHRASPQFLLATSCPFAPWASIRTSSRSSTTARSSRPPRPRRPGQQSSTRSSSPAWASFRATSGGAACSRREPSENFVPGFRPRSFLHGLPSYIHTVHEDQYFTQFIIPIDRDHLYNMCAMTGEHAAQPPLVDVLLPDFHDTHDTISSARTTACCATARPRAALPLGSGLVRWRQFAVQNARGYRQDQSPAASEPTRPTVSTRRPPRWRAGYCGQPALSSNPDARPPRGRG